MEFYTRKQINESLFEVNGPHGEIITNHNGKSYYGDTIGMTIPNLVQNINF